MKHVNDHLLALQLRVFFCMIPTCEHFFFSLRFELYFFHAELYRRKLCSLEFYSFLNYEMIKQITKEKVNERWLPED